MAKIKDNKVRIEIEGGECKFNPEINEVVCVVDAEKLPIRIELPHELFDELSIYLSKYDEEIRRSVIREIERIAKIYKSIGD